MIQSLLEKKKESASIAVEDLLVLIKDCIRSTCENEDSPDQQLQQIASIWEQLDKTSRLAEAKTRILLGQIGKPDLAIVPDWFNAQLSELTAPDDELAPAHPLAIDSSKKLVQACLHEIPEAQELEADIAKSPLGRVLLDWTVPPNILQWIVEAVELPWPGVKVHVLSLDCSDSENKPVTRTFYNAFDLVEHFREQLRRFQQASN